MLSNISKCCFLRKHEVFLFDYCCAVCKSFFKSLKINRKKAVGVAGKQSVFYEQKLKMKLFALSRVWRVMLQLDWCNSTHYERISPLAEPAGGKHGTGTAGVLWACRAVHWHSSTGEIISSCGTGTPRKIQTAIPACPIKRGGGERRGVTCFYQCAYFISVSHLIRCGKCFLLCQRKKEWKWQLIVS